MQTDVEPATAPRITYGNVADAATDIIRQMIVDGHLQPGTWLRQDELARQLGVSSIPVREAMRHLEAEGLVVFKPRCGAEVAQPSPAEFEELDRISETLEVLACNWASEHFDTLALDEMRQALAELEDAEVRGDVARRLRLVREFRFILYRATGKNHLIQIIGNLFDKTVAYRRLFTEVSELAPARIEVYRRIYQACEQQDLAALLQAMHDLYELARRTIMAQLGYRVNSAG